MISVDVCSSTLNLDSVTVETIFTERELFRVCGLERNHAVTLAYV